MAQLAFKEYDDPGYWKEGEEDRRDQLGVLISYRDLKAIAAYLPDKLTEDLVARLDRWGDRVEDLLDVSYTR